MTARPISRASLKKRGVSGEDEGHGRLRKNKRKEKKSKKTKKHDLNLSFKVHLNVTLSNCCSSGVIQARAAIISTQTARSCAAPTRHSRRIMSILPPQAPRDARQKDHARRLELLPRRVYRNITSSRPGERQTDTHKHTHTQARRVEMMSTCCLLIKYEWYKGYRNVEKYHRYKGQ